MFANLKKRPIAKEWLFRRKPLSYISILLLTIAIFGCETQPTGQKLTAAIMKLNHQEIEKQLRNSPELNRYYKIKVGGYDWYQSPLGAAVAMDNTRQMNTKSLAERLIKLGADVNYGDALRDKRPGSWSPIKTAIMSGNLPMLDVLIKHGADITGGDYINEYYGSRGELIQYLSTLNQAVFKKLAPLGLPIDHLYHRGQTTLIIMSKNPTGLNLSGIKLLIEAGADQSIEDDQGLSALAGVLLYESKQAIAHPSAIASLYEQKLSHKPALSVLSRYIKNNDKQGFDYWLSKTVTQNQPDLMGELLLRTIRTYQLKDIKWIDKLIALGANPHWQGQDDLGNNINKIIECGGLRHDIKQYIKKIRAENPKAIAATKATGCTAS